MGISYTGTAPRAACVVLTHGPAAALLHALRWGHVPWCFDPDLVHTKQHVCRCWRSKHTEKRALLEALLQGSSPCGCSSAGEDRAGEPVKQRAALT